MSGRSCQRGLEMKRILACVVVCLLLPFTVAAQEAAEKCPADGRRKIEERFTAGEHVDRSAQLWTDGFRVLVDRLWPRGIKKEKAALDAWTRELAPSTSLRQWFGHDPKRFAEFGKRYRAELGESAEAIEALRQRTQQ